MKYAFLILIFCCGKLFPQVGPPSLRCLQVQPNGDVTLIWVPPADPGGQFDSYDVFTSISPTGVFALVANLTGPVTTSTYVHSGAGADIQSRYYYIVTKYGPSGSSVSGHSDTLRSIFMDLNPGTGNQVYLKISYNNLHQPKLFTTSSTFSITKEYPLGSWNTLATTTALSYNDTLSVCSASINYQVRVLDNFLGCFSSSNYKGDIFKDQKDPDEPAIDSISVLANGNVVLAWKIPPDKDITKYRIYEFKNGGNFIIDTVFGRPNNTYTYVTATSNSQSVTIFVSALDSCAKISNFTNTGSSMFLTRTYDRCNYRTDLSWTPYKNMPKGLLEYRVYYSPDATNYTAIGTTTNTSFSHLNVDPDKNVCYFVRAFNIGRTISASSNRPCFFSTQVQAPRYLYVRSASVLPDNSIRLKLFVDSGKYSKGIDIFRSLNGLNFDQVGFIPTNGVSDYIFNDTKNVNPADSSYYYRASIKDSCGNTRSVSNISKTILLKVREDKEFIFTKYLSWSTYAGFGGGLKDYNIYRVVNGATTPEFIGNSGLFSTSFTDNLEDEAAYGSRIEYMVEAVEGFANPFGFRETATSNNKAVYMEGRIFVPAAFSPNGKNKVWLPVTHFIDKNEYKVRVFNRWGNTVFETADDTMGWDGDGAPTGIYAYVISYKNSRGEYQELKGTLLLL